MKTIHSFEEFCSLNESEMIQEVQGANFTSIEALVKSTKAAFSDVYKKAMTEVPNKSDVGKRSKVLGKLMFENPVLTTAGNSYVQSLENLLAEAKKEGKFSFMKSTARGWINNINLLAAAAKEAEDNALKTPGTTPKPPVSTKPVAGPVKPAAQPTPAKKS